MSSLELNKIIGALLLAGMVALVSGILAKMLVHPRPAPHVAAVVAEGEAGGEAESAPTGEPEQPLPVLLAAADAAAGEGVAKRCAACHTFDNGGANKVGPNLWNVVGAHQAHMEGFAYSDAVKNLGGTWTFEELDKFLASPKDYAPGTKMTFAGLKKATDRANLLAYLHSLSDSPVPLPAASAAPAPEATTAEAAAPAATTETAEAAAPAAETQAAAAPAAEAGDGGEIGALLASADVANGEKLAKRCTVCHSFDSGGANKIGPNLWNIVGAHQAHMEGYAYSDAIKNLGGTWDYAALDAWIASPKDYAPGNKMTFAGLKKPEDRADLIAWLRTLSDSPQPLP